MSLTVQCRHLQQLKLCGRGRRAWFERHGLDYSRFVTHGLPIDEVDKIDDEFARQVVAFVRQQSENSHGKL